MKPLLSRLFPFLDSGKKEQEALIEKAHLRAKELVVKAKEEALQIELEAEKTSRKKKQDLLSKEANLEAREQQVEIQLKRINTDRVSLDKERESIRLRKEELLKKLEEISKLSQKDAREMVLNAWEDKLKGEISKKIRAAEEEVRAKADEKAREILVDAIRFGAVDYTPEYTLSSISLPSDDYKGRIIGKEGRNIRAFELATGVDVDLEGEGEIRISSFDAVRREVAKVALERLIKDGRIQPPRIEEIVKKVQQETDKLMVQAGEDLCHRVGVYNLQHDLVKMLGRFKYRFSYGQNMILHTLEETRIGVALAHELKADVNTVKLGCLLHDIGKVVVDEEGSHVQLGVDLLRKYRLPEAVIHTVEAHHEDIPFESVEAVIVYIADAISGGRPGARHEDLEEYIKRIKTIEETAMSMPGVSQVYALQAGRELRVIVKPDQVGDGDTEVMGQKIKEELEKKFPTFPGQITITIIRETRTTTTTHG
ncbi:MAG: Ribonuclease Y [Microgenomates bacterium OLB22]|nr:MAG: Ribonuclease Y [Microgenomates bacterium OLB22]